MPRFLFVVANLDWEGPAIGGKELKGPLGWVEVATPEGCGHPVGWEEEWCRAWDMAAASVGCVSDGAAGRRGALTMAAPCVA